MSSTLYRLIAFFQKEQSVNDCAETNRNRSIRNGISSSLLSKVSSLVLQIVALPLAARELGKVEFGIFTTVSITITAVILLELGIGPALGKKISEAHAASRRDKEQRLYFNGVILVTLLSLGAVLVIGSLTLILPITALFGQHYEGWETTMNSAIWIGAILFALLTIISHVDRTREGYMEASVAYAWASLGNFLAGLGIIVALWINPSVNTLLLAMFVPQILVRILNLIFMWRKRPYLNFFKNRPPFCRKSIKELFSDGLSYTATYNLVYLVEVNVCALVVGRMYGPSEVALHQAATTIMLAFYGLLVMIGTPMWAAMVDAMERGDRKWMVNSTKRYYYFFCALSIGAFIGLGTIGPWFISKWYGAEFNMPHNACITLSLFLAVMGWRQIHQSLSLGLNLLKDTVKPIVLSVLLNLGLGVLGLKYFGLAGLFAGQAIGTLLLTAVILPSMIWRTIKSA